MNNGIGSVRRFYLLKRITSRRLEDGMDGIWRSKQEEIAGTALPDDFPSRAELEAAGYTAREDLDIGIDAQELIDYACLTRKQALAVLAAHAAL